MSNICAGIGRGQMMVLNERVKKRRQIFYFYKQLLEDIPGIFFQEERRNMYSNRWLTTILLNPGSTPGQISSEILKKFLEDDNIESRPLWKPMHLQPVFQTAMFYGDQTSSRLFERGLCLPSGTNMSEKEMERIKERILFLFNHS
jgi:dTDP-4-amino-4,6-dideoxygalactose transaminase